MKRQFGKRKKYEATRTKLNSGYQNRPLDRNGDGKFAQMGKNNVRMKFRRERN